jgi:hypothetical protein
MDWWYDELGYATWWRSTVNPLTLQQLLMVYNSMLQTDGSGRKGVIANLPYKITLPYFYVIQYNQLTQR